MSNTRRPDLSIIIPALSEARRIGKTLDQLAHYLAHDDTLVQLRTEVIIVAADAPDNTPQAARQKQHLFDDFTVLRPGPKIGKGRDVQYGMLRAKGAVVMFMDADLATPISYLAEFYQHHIAGNDIVIATRNLHRHHPNFWRRLLSNCGNLLFRLASGLWVEDSQCGFKLFSAAASRSCFSQQTIMGWGFDMEILAIAKAKGYSIKTHRVNDWASVPDGVFTENIFKNSFTSLQELSIIFWNRLRGIYR